MASILYEMEQMLTALSDLSDLDQESAILSLSLGAEVALLESFLVHIRNLADVFSNSDPGPDGKNIRCKHYGFPKVEELDVLGKDERMRINTYMSHPSYGRGCPTDIPNWSLHSYRLIYKRSLKFLCHVRDNKPQLVDSKKRERIEMLSRKLKDLLDYIPAPNKLYQHRGPMGPVVTSSSDPAHTGYGVTSEAEDQAMESKSADPSS